MITVNGFPIDAALSESHQRESDVTENPVEEGSPSTDHIRKKNDSVTLECIVSDTPIGDVASERETGALPSADAHDFMVALHEAGEPVTIETSLGVYKSMALKSLTEPRSVGNGESLRFSATFVRVRIVKNTRTTVRVAVPKAKHKKNRGSTNAVETPGAADRAAKNPISQKQSIAHDLIFGDQSVNLVPAGGGP